MNGDTLVNEKDIEKSYEAVARPFNFKNIKELIALLQQFFYINYFSSENGGENLLKKKISETLGYELELYCDADTDKDSIRERFYKSLAVMAVTICLNRKRKGERNEIRRNCRNPYTVT